MQPRLLISAVVAILLCGSSCATHRQIRSNALDFLYPQGGEAVPANDVKLKLPVRVGVAFAPGADGAAAAFTETQKQESLSRIAAAFEGLEGIGSVETIPSAYLAPRGGFENLDRLATAFGIHLMVLVSYDQIQFTETGRSSWAYWTLVGAYVVKGEKNETRTLLDAVVYDIPSRTMLFHATGRSGGRGASTPIDVGRELRKRSEAGFDEATGDLIVNLRTALEAFEAQAGTGSVHGPGTPAITLFDASGNRVRGGGGGGGAGAVGPAALAGAALLAALMLAARRRGGWPRVTPGVIGAALLLGALPGADEALQYDRAAVAAGEIWRLVTGQLVHWTPRMALADLAVILAAGAWVERRSRRLAAFTMAGGALMVGAGLPWLAPGLAFYRGSSGVAAALFVVAALDLAHRMPRGGIWAAAFLSLLALKILFEQTTGVALAAGALPAGVMVAPQAHLLGALAGLFASAAPALRRHGIDRAARGGSPAAGDLVATPVGRG